MTGISPAFSRHSSDELERDVSPGEPAPVGPSVIPSGAYGFQFGHSCRGPEPHIDPQQCVAANCGMVRNVNTTSRGAGCAKLACGLLAMTAQIPTPRLTTTEPLRAQEILRAEERHAVRQGLADLSKTQQELLLLLVADPPVPYCEISRRMNLPIGSIGPTRARLLKKLQRSLSVHLLTEDVPGAVSAAA